MMRYFDPERPKLQESPLLLGTGMVLPGLRFEPNEDGSWTVSCFLPSEGFRSFSTSLHSCQLNGMAQIDALFRRYLEDPEKLLQEWFKWKRPEPAAAVPDFATIMKLIGGKKDEPNV